MNRLLRVVLLASSIITMQAMESNESFIDEFPCAAKENVGSFAEQVGLMEKLMKAYRFVNNGGLQCVESWLDMHALFAPNAKLVRGKYKMNRVPRLRITIKGHHQIAHDLLMRQFCCPLKNPNTVSVEVLQPEYFLSTWRANVQYTLQVTQDPKKKWSASCNDTFRFTYNPESEGQLQIKKLTHYAEIVGGHSGRFVLF